MEDISNENLMKSMTKDELSSKTQNLRNIYMLEKKSYFEIQDPDQNQ